MSTLSQHIINLASFIGADIKDLRVKQGDLSSLTTTQKTNIVDAINELATIISGSGVPINDTAGDGDITVTWSADKIFDTIEAAKTAIKNELLNGASATLDTLSELATALGNDANFSTMIATALANRVRYDAAQTLDATQKATACSNIGIGDPDVNFVTIYDTAKS